MKNLIAKISSVVVLAIILTAVSAQAQTFRQYRAQIPFNFKIANKAYQAGDYIISVRGQLNRGAVLAVENAGTHNIRAMFVLQNGNRSRADKTVLMFDRHGEQNILTQMVSPDFGLSAPKTKTKTLLAKKRGQPEETVAIVLTEKVGNTE